MNEEYLYGAAVQGIQSFIFQTNELKDIVGASELVEQICTDAFKAFGGEKENSILRAAGNIKHIFTDKKACEKAVLEFPKKVMKMAPGITISQAVVKMKDKSEFPKAVDELESRLRIQRNKPMPSTTIGLMGILRSRKTGLPVVFYDEKNKEYLDAATYEKRYEVNDKENTRRKRTTKNLCEKCFNIKDISDKQIAYDIEEITTKNDWIAIIHADGNGLGQIVQKIGQDEKVLKEFSQKLDKATIKSAQEAYKSVEPTFGTKNNFIPIRPIVLGGDDMTVIIRGDLAVDYCKAYLSAFEKNTKDMLGAIVNNHADLTNDQKTILQNGLTACAGIAFIKSSFPFYYGYNLAEQLCDRAKKDAKSFNQDLAPSCLMFHKVQDSFVEKFEDIVKRELTPQKDLSFEFGPFYLTAPDGRWNIDQLQNNIKLLDSKEGNAVKSHLRQWMSILHSNGIGTAEQKRKRVLSLLSDDKLNKLVEISTESKNGKFPVYDMLSLSSVINQKTKNQEDKE